MHATTLPEGCKFVLKYTSDGIELVAGRLPTKEGQLFKGQDANGSKVEVVMSSLGLVFYHGWS